MKPSSEALRDRDRLIAFRGSYVELLNSSRRVDDWPHNRLMPGNDAAAWERLRQQVAHDAGAAVAAYQRMNGGLLNLRTQGMAGLHPIVNWQASLDDYDIVKPSFIVAAVEGAIGTAQQRYEDAQGRERGMVGLVAAFLRWPRTLREAVGPERGSRGVATTLGVFGQIVVGTIVTAIGGAIATGLIAAVVALWRLLFGS